MPVILMVRKTHHCSLRADRVCAPLQETKKPDREELAREAFILPKKQDEAKEARLTLRDTRHLLSDNKARILCLDCMNQNTDCDNGV